MDTGDKDMEVEDVNKQDNDDDSSSEEEAKVELQFEDIDITPFPNVQAAADQLKELEYHVVKCTTDDTIRFRRIEDNGGFKWVNQKHYDKLGDVLCDWIQAYMVDFYKMAKVEVPLEEHRTKNAGTAPIFKSEDWETNTERALVLIQGTGDVRSGYWARSVCMNDTLELGSMLPDIEFAKNNGFSYIVFNPNYSKTPDGTLVDSKIRGMNHHSSYVWDNFVEDGKCPAKEIFIVAHSAGGACAHEIIVDHEDTMVEKVKAIALTDACHGNFVKDLTKEGKVWAIKSCIAYDSSSQPLDTPLDSRYLRSVFPQVSAGHQKHVYTTGCARESYLKWFINQSETLKND